MTFRGYSRSFSDIGSPPTGRKLPYLLADNQCHMINRSSRVNAAATFVILSAFPTYSTFLVFGNVFLNLNKLGQS